MSNSAPWISQKGLGIKHPNFKIAEADKPSRKTTKTVLDTYYVERQRAGSTVPEVALFLLLWYI